MDLSQIQAYQYPGMIQPSPAWTQEDWTRWHAAQQAYWDPSYWWGQGMQGMPGMQEGVYSGAAVEGEDQPPSASSVSLISSGWTILG